MRALVVYESMYGNTHAVADSIAAGLRATHEVTVVPVSQATPELVADADLIVAGGPTHLHGLSTASSRRQALTAARAKNSGLTIDPGADGPGLRAWLADLGSRDILTASYDTRLGARPLLTGRASRAIARMLTRHGGRLVVPPESFLVNGENQLKDGEAARACRWGGLVGETAAELALSGRR